MTQFQLDTSGAVAQPGLYRSLRWSDLSPFTQGYIEAAAQGLAIFTDSDSDGWGGPVLVTVLRPLLVPQEADAEVGPMWKIKGADGREKDAFAAELRPIAFSDLARETLDPIIADCAAFQYPKIGAADWIVFDHATGGDFWRDRQGRQLTAHSSRAFPPLTVQLGDDGKVRFA